MTGRSTPRTTIASEFARRKAARRARRAPAAEIERREEKPQGLDYAWIILFLLPFLVLYAGFTLWPLAATVYYSFFDWDGFHPLTDFVGFENYLTIIRDPIFWLSFRNTMFFAIVNTTIKLPLSLFVAIVLTRKWLRRKNLFRTIFFSPMVIPVAMAGMIFSLLLNPANGALNDVLVSTGLVDRPIDFLGNGKTAMWSLILVSVWQIFGQYMIYWMAALQNVPTALYEAAEIDGANEWDKLTKITLPVIRPVATIITFLAFVNALKVFGLVVTMTSGGPGQQTYVVPYFIYNQAFSSIPFRYGYASAAAVFFGLIVLAAVSVQGYFVSRAQAGSGGSDAG
jgi:ABC-type sugar transport system permease subunit